MPTGVRMMNSGDPRFYSPARDLAYNTDQIVGRAFHHVSTEKVEKLKESIASGPAESAEAIGEVAAAIVGFLHVVPLGDEIENVPDAFTFSKLRELQEKYPATAATVFSTIGRMFLSAAFYGIRDTVKLDDPEYLTDAALFTHRARAQMIWNDLPRWKKFLIRKLPSALGVPWFQSIVAKDENWADDMHRESLAVVSRAELVRDVSKLLKEAIQHGQAKTVRGPGQAEAQVLEQTEPQSADSSGGSGTPPQGEGTGVRSPGW